MMCLFQLLNMETGQRSEPMELEPPELAQLLLDNVAPADLDDQAVLVLMEKPIPDEEYKFSRAPFMRANTFINHFKREAA